MSIELQKIDCNCNDCKFLWRDLELSKKWEDKAREYQEEEFNKSYHKAVEDANIAIFNAKNDADRRSCEGVLRKAQKMKFQFNRISLIRYGGCAKLGKRVSFIEGICQLETQDCFEHRRG